MDKLELAQYATEYTIIPNIVQEQGNQYHQRDYTVQVSRRSDNVYAILYHGSCWDKGAKDWVWEPMPSARTEEFLKQTRYSLDEAAAELENALASVEQEFLELKKMFKSSNQPLNAS